MWHASLKKPYLAGCIYVRPLTTERWIGSNSHSGVTRMPSLGVNVLRVEDIVNETGHLEIGKSIKSSFSYFLSSEEITER